MFRFVSGDEDGGGGGEGGARLLVGVIGVIGEGLWFGGRVGCVLFRYLGEEGGERDEI